jgi:hypothetical protein
MKRRLYNAPTIQNMLRAPNPRLVLCLLAFVLCARFGSAQAGADWGEALRQLAQKVAALSGPGAVAIAFDNRSSMGRLEAGRAQRELTSDLEALGLKPADENAAAATVHVTFSESLGSYVWVAAVAQGGADSSIVMVKSPRRVGDVSPDFTNAVTIRKTLLWIQPEPILDAALVTNAGAASTLIVLDPAKIAIYSQRGSQWQLTQSLPIAHKRRWPRDVRGRLAFPRDHLFDAYLPGVACASTTAPPLGLSCREAEDAWPLGTAEFTLRAFFSPTRNFFTGVVTPAIGKQSSLAPFFSAAPLPRSKYVLWLAAGVDGAVHMLDGVSNVTLPRSNWGSSIASVKSSCGAGWQVLAGGAGDGNSADAVRAYEVPDREPVAASAPEPFAGPITALWAEGNGEAATAVTQNLKAGTYEAYRLAIACNQ